MDSMALFTMGTGGHYITMLPGDWSIHTSHDLSALHFLWWKLHGIQLVQFSSFWFDNPEKLHLQYRGYRSWAPL